MGLRLRKYMELRENWASESYSGPYRVQTLDCKCWTSLLSAAKGGGAVVAVGLKSDMYDCFFVKANWSVDFTVMWDPWQNWQKIEKDNKRALKLGRSRNGCMPMRISNRQVVCISLCGRVTWCRNYSQWPVCDGGDGGTGQGFEEDAEELGSATCGCQFDGSRAAGCQWLKTCDLLLSDWNRLFNSFRDRWRKNLRNVLHKSQSFAWTDTE